jgi:hypothetical protein
MSTNTQWERVSVSEDTMLRLRNTHYVWSRILDGERIYTVRPIGETPGENDGGYLTIHGALYVKGML